MARKFQRHIENFTCQNCGMDVVGNGYTNHCPHCLWSRHVDVSPGDRAATCGGLMPPIAIEQTSVGFILTHCCQTCGHKMRCKSSAEDNSTTLIGLARALADGRSK